MTPIHTKRLIIRNWEDRDRDLFFRINSDDQVMEFFPFRRDRAQSDAVFDRLKADIAERGYGFRAGRDYRHRRVHRLRRPLRHQPGAFPARRNRRDRLAAGAANSGAMAM